VLLPPNKNCNVPAPLANKIAISLATRYGITVAAARKYIPTQLSQWGKVCRLEGGDTMHARDLVRLSEKDRDASYVRVSTYIQQLLPVYMLRFALYVHTITCSILNLSMSMLAVGMPIPCIGQRIFTDSFAILLSSIFQFQRSCT
jgi:hypothetical protein